MGMIEYQHEETGEVRVFFQEVTNTKSPAKQLKRPDGVWNRIFSAPGVISGKKDDGVKPGLLRRYGDLPVSVTLPKDPRKGELVNRGGYVVRAHKDGTFSTEDGRPIVGNKTDIQKHGERSGCEFD